MPNIWNTNLVLEFLELFAAEPVLYDPKHPYYKNKKMNDIAWLRIQQALSENISMLELKKKRESLMASFRYQLRKKREAALTGEDVSNSKKEWLYFDIMYRFLGQVYENETVLSTEDSGPVLEFVGFDALDDSFMTDDCSPTPQEPKPKSVEEDSKLRSILLENKPKKATKRKHPPNTEQLETQSLPDQVSTDSQNDEDDECDLYGKLIAKKLKKLPEVERERLMYEIQGLFTKASQRR